MPSTSPVAQPHISSRTPAADRHATYLPRTGIDATRSPCCDRSCRACVWLLALAWLLTPASVWGADTTETYAPGLSDAELYLGAERLGPVGADRVLTAEVLLGVGLHPALSSYLGLKLSRDLGETVSALSWGLFGTPLDTDHLDFDLGVEFKGEGTQLSDLYLTPWCELNLDAAPNLAWMGLYARVKGLIWLNAPTPQGDGGVPGRITLEAILGGYYSLGPKDQFLVEYDMFFRSRPRAGMRTVEIGRLAFGYNRTLSPRFELLSQLALDLPQRGERPAFNLMLGLIASFGGSTALPRTTDRPFSIRALE